VNWNKIKFYRCCNSSNQKAKHENCAAGELWANLAAYVWQQSPENKHLCHHFMDEKKCTIPSCATWSRFHRELHALLFSSTASIPNILFYFSQYQIPKNRGLIHLVFFGFPESTTWCLKEAQMIPIEGRQVSNCMWIPRRCGGSTSTISQSHGWGEEQGTLKDWGGYLMDLSYSIL
jgi:hypothetical protein